MSFFNIEKMKEEPVAVEQPVQQAQPEGGVPTEEIPVVQQQDPAAPAGPAVPVVESPVTPVQAQQQAEPGKPNFIPPKEEVQSSSAALQEQQQAAAPVTPETPGANQPTVEELEAQWKAKYLAELNVESEDALRQRLNPQQELTPEQQKRNDDLHRSAVQDYAVRNLNMSPTDFVEMDNVKKMSDQDIVFKNYKDKWLAENKDNPEYAGKDLDTEVRYEFEEYFHLNSENERLKKQGQKGLEQAAANYRSEYDNAYKAAETHYNESREWVGQVTQYKAVVTGALNNLPKERTFKINDNESVAYDLSSVDKAKLERFLVNDNNFAYFREKGGQEAATFLNQKINEYIQLHHGDDIINTAIRTAHDVGVRAGKVGAKAPFVEQPQTPLQQAAEDLTPADHAKLKSIFNFGRVR